MKKYFLPFMFMLCLLSLAFKCDNDDTVATQEGDRAQLNSLKSEIENLANASVCSDANTCKFIGLGSKPCGGPWEYLVYSESIHEEKLEQLVDNYNKKEKDFNVKWGAISDCSITNPPSNLKCENNICIAEY